MLLFIVALLATPAADATPTPSATPVQAAAETAAGAAAKADGDKLECKREMVTGSRFPTKVCRRKADVAQKRQDDQDRLRQEQRWTGGTVH
ncbi:MAG: hypothetical protein ABI655_15440 [Phenylobacterium sp.]